MRPMSAGPGNRGFPSMNPRLENVKIPHLPGYNVYDPRDLVRGKKQGFQYIHGIPGEYKKEEDQRPQTARPATADTNAGPGTHPWAQLGGAKTGWTMMSQDPILVTGTGVGSQTARPALERPASAAASAPWAPTDPAIAALGRQGNMTARPMSARPTPTPAPEVLQFGAVPHEEVVPAWIAFDRQVLRFFAYFTETVPESPLEQSRVRQCTIYFYLEDGTLHIGEKKESNSGLPQGVLLKRHRVPHPSGAGGFLGIQDLAVGQPLYLYSRKYNIVACDEFTREFLEREGFPVASNGDFPTDHFHERQRQQGEKTPRAVSSSAGKQRQFLDNDRKVLRFFCTWDNRDEMYGDRRAYVMHYYLADDTVEILEVVERNSGRDPFPKLLNRGQLPKQIYSLGARPMSEETRRRVKHEFYNWKEFRIGGTIRVYGRNIMLHDCDDFTRSYYMHELGLTEKDFMPFPIEVAKKPAAPTELPPHTGLAVGTDEDSAQSCLRLIPKPRQRDWHKWESAQGKELIFTARFAEDATHHITSQVDLDRRFVLKYFLEDDTLSIFEPPIRNSGVVGGPFLYRSPVKKPGSKIQYKSRDLYIGSLLDINRRLFEITGADEATLKALEADTKQHPLADFQYAVKLLAHKLEEGKLADTFRSGVIRADNDARGFIRVEELKEVVKGCGLPSQVAVTIARRIAPEDEILSVVELFNLIGQEV